MNCVFFLVLYRNNGAHQDNCWQRTRKDLTWHNSRCKKRRERETAKPPANVRAALFSNCIWRCLNVIKMCGPIRLHPQKNPGETVLGMLFLLNEWKKRRWVRRRLRKRKRGMKTLTAVLCEGLCMARAKKNKARARLGIWFQPRAAAGNAAPPGEGCRSTAMAHFQNLLSQNTSPSSSFKSLYVSPSFPFSPGQDHSPSTGLCIFSDSPGLEFRPKSFVWEASHFTLAFAYRGEGQWKPGPTCHEKVTLVKSSIASKGPLSPSGSHNQHGWLQNEGSGIIKLLWWIQES